MTTDHHVHTAAEAIALVAARLGISGDDLAAEACEEGWLIHAVEDPASRTIGGSSLLVTAAGDAWVFPSLPLPAVLDLHRRGGGRPI